LSANRKLVLFDLDHTLLDGDSDVLWCEFLMQRGILDRESFAARNAALDRDIAVRGFWRVFQVPRHVTSFVVTRQWTKRLTTTADLCHYSSYFNSYFAVNRSRAFAFPGFTKADLVGAFMLWGNDSRRLRLYGQVENLLNQRWYQNGWLAPRANFRTGLTLAF